MSALLHRPVALVGQFGDDAGGDVARAEQVTQGFVCVTGIGEPGRILRIESRPVVGVRFAADALLIGTPEAALVWAKVNANDIAHPTTQGRAQCVVKRSPI